ncbi:hypothetical protein [Candidatus Accumulibacter sp. ACC003]|uniref:hypothetical protein n=1 Tax=Candidatus Accumulibacter sp. ACC003 TaxID=2823334 RepID=UPI0025BC1B3E|nr:hypothetical protein [Candidatus Accumulibacter sp. ACC003]
MSEFSADTVLRLPTRRHRPTSGKLPAAASQRAEKSPAIVAQARGQGDGNGKLAAGSLPAGQRVLTNDGVLGRRFDLRQHAWRAAAAIIDAQGRYGYMGSHNGRLGMIE